MLCFPIHRSSLDQKYLTQHVQTSMFLMWTGFKIIDAHARGRRALRDSAKTEKQNHAQEKKEKKLVYKEAWENVYASLI